MGKLQPKGEIVYAIPSSPDIPLCDGCHLQPAKFRIIIDGSHELFLCGHHFRKHRLALVRYKIDELVGS